MGDRLHIVATCTDRKSRSAEPDLLVRNLPTGPGGSPRVDAWIERRTSSDASAITAGALYQGELWRAALDLAEVARATGRQVALWVVSAGYGLVGAESIIRPYGATFSSGAPDSVSRATTKLRSDLEARAWWRSLTCAPVDRAQPSSLADLAEMASEDELLFCLSGAYLNACHDDLLAARHAHPSAVLFSAGAASQPEHADWAPAFDSRVQGKQRPLGGTRTSLNVRVAAHVLSAIGEGPLDPSMAGRCTAALMEGLRAAPSYGRRAASDDEVIEFVHSLLARDTTMSHTRALRHFRDVEQRACEQKRFARLFREARGTFQEVNA